jgi:hypothetical protein
MSSRATLLALAGTVLLGSGCYKVNYVAAPSAPYPQVTQWHHIGLVGLVEFSSPVMLDQICPGGFARVENEISFVNGLVSNPVLPSALGFFGLSWVYQPHTVKVYCKSGQSYQVELDDEGMALSAESLPQ